MNALVEEIPGLFQSWRAALSAHRKRMQERGIVGQITSVMQVPPEPVPVELLKLTHRLSLAAEGVGIPETPLADLSRDPFNVLHLSASEKFAIDFRRKFAARLLYGLPLVLPSKPECSVSIDDEGRAVINGVPTNKPLTPTQRTVIQLMIDAFPAGVLKDKFTANGVDEGTARRILRKFREKYPQWQAVIAMPDRDGKGLGYRLRPRHRPKPTA